MDAALKASLKKFEEKGFKFIDFLHSNHRKKTFVFKTMKNYELFVIKIYIGKRTGVDWEQFRKELRPYRKLSSDIIAKVEVVGDDFLILPFIEGILLSKLLEEEQLCLVHGINLLEDLQKIYNDCYQSVEMNKITLFGATKRLNVLLRSRPLQSANKQISQGRKIWTYLLYLLLCALVRLLLIGVNKNQLLPGFSHGDLHFNNIIKTEDRFCILDFENYSETECFIFDIFFLSAMVRVNLKDKNTRKSFDEKVNSFVDSWQLSVIKKIFYASMKINKRFLVVNYEK